MDIDYELKEKKMCFSISITKGGQNSLLSFKMSNSTEFQFLFFLKLLFPPFTIK